MPNANSKRSLPSVTTLLIVAFVSLSAYVIYLHLALDASARVSRNQERQFNGEAARLRKALVAAEKRRAESDDDNQTLLQLFATNKDMKAPATSLPALPSGKLNSGVLLDRLAKGHELAKRGLKQEALGAFLSCFDDGTQVPSFKGARRSAVLMALVALAETYPPARLALEERRETAKREMLANPKDTESPGDLAAINKILKDDAATILAFDSLAPGDSRRAQLAQGAYDALVERRRYSDALEGRNEQLINQLFYSGLSQAQRSESPMREKIQAATISSAVRAVEVLAGAGKGPAAEDLALRILKLDPSADTQRRLAEAAAKAGKPAVLINVIKP